MNRLQEMCRGNSMVSVNQNPSSVSVCVPSSILHAHLISNNDLIDWKGMMTIIEDELASPKIIIDQTVNEIEKMKIATSDRGFIEFVDSLEKIHRDLSTLNQLPEIANTSVLSKLECKLPAQISHDWTDKVIDNKLSKKTSSEKFNL